MTSECIIMCDVTVFIIIYRLSNRVVDFLKFWSYVIIIIWYYRVMFVYIGRGEDVIIW